MSPPPPNPPPFRHLTSGVRPEVCLPWVPRSLWWGCEGAIGCALSCASIPAVPSTVTRERQRSLVWGLLWGSPEAASLLPLGPGSPQGEGVGLAPDDRLWVMKHPPRARHHARHVTRFTAVHSQHKKQVLSSPPSPQLGERRTRQSSSWARSHTQHVTAGIQTQVPLPPCMIVVHVHLLDRHTSQFAKPLLCSSQAPGPGASRRYCPLTVKGTECLRD